MADNTFTQFQLPPPIPDQPSPFIPSGGSVFLAQGTQQSPNFRTGQEGWMLDAKGNAEFQNVIINGSITSSSGAIGGFSIGSDYIRDTANSFGMASTVTAGDDVRFWAGAAYASRSSAPFRVTEAGVVSASNIAITGGSITSTPISSIPNSSSTDISLLDLTHDLVFSVTDKDTVAWASGTITMSNGRTFSISSGNTGDMAARTFIYLDTAVSSTVLQTTTTVATAMGANKKLIATANKGNAQATFTVYDGIGGIKLGASNTSVSNNNWTYSGAWSVSSATQIAWGAGTLSTSDGGAYSISGSNTGTMSAKTYIYFDLSVSSTAFQITTTASTAIGDGKILIAIAQNDTDEANFVVVNDKQLNINASNIVAGSITANEIAAGTITAAKLSVSQLSAITADMGAITAGTIVLAASGYIRSGQTDYNTGSNGFFLGISGGAAKFSVGNPTGDRFTFDGTTASFYGTFNIGGTTVTVSTFAAIQTALDAVATAGGGTVWLTPGTYTMTTDLSIAGGCQLKGVSRDGCILDAGTHSLKIVGSSPYSTGTLSVSDGSTAVTGVGTTWTAGMVGQQILLNGLWYDIASRASNTSITLVDAYQGTTLSGSSYVIATVNYHALVSTLTVINASTSAIVNTYAQETFFDDVIVDSCSGTGFNLDYCVAPYFFCGVTNNGTNLDMNYVSSFEVRFSVFDNSVTSYGVVMANCTNATFFDSSCSGNTSDGINLTSCSNITFLSVDVSSNGGNGVQFVSGNSDLQFNSVTVNGNTSDGYKLTASTVRCVIVDASVINNGGYGVNVVDVSSNVGNVIGPNTYSGNDVTGLDTGFIAPTAITVDGVSTQWTNPNNMKASDNVYATAAANAIRNLAGTFGLQSVIPNGSVIVGFEVSSEAKVSSTTNSPTIRYYASPDGGTNFYGELIHTLATSEATVVLGTSTELWSRTWTWDELSDTNFKLRVQATIGVGTPTFSLDQVMLKVFYTRPASAFAVHVGGVGNEIIDSPGLDMGSVQQVRRMRNTSGSTIAAGAVVTWKANSFGNEVTTTTTAADPKSFGMAMESIADQAFGYVLFGGRTTLLKVDGTTDIAIGDMLTTFTTAGIAKKASTGNAAFAIAMEGYTTNDSNGVIDALILPYRVAAP